MQVSKHHRYVHSCIGMVNSAVLMLWDVKYKHQKNNKTMENHPQGQERQKNRGLRIVLMIPTENGFFM